MNTTKYFHSDAGHGWLAVKDRDVAELGITALISDFSYQKGQTVYLEEDKDAQTFLNAAKEKGLDIVVKKAKVVKRSNIRSFPTFSKI